MSPNPQSFLQHLREKGYNGRSNKHSNALAEAIVRDFVGTCPAAAAKAAAGELVYALNRTIVAGTSDWNVDLVFGTPPPGTGRPSTDQAILESAPSTVQIAIEIKSTMTEHHKAVKNRKRDFEAHHDHVHRYDRAAIAGAVFVVNQAANFSSTTRSGRTTHREPARLVEHCIREIRSVAIRADVSGTGLDAKAVIVLDMDNIDLSTTGYVSSSPAPQVGDPLHYDAFIQKLCTLYTDRYA